MQTCSCKQVKRNVISVFLDELPATKFSFMSPKNAHASLSTSTQVSTHKSSLHDHVSQRSDQQRPISGVYVCCVLPRATRSAVKCHKNALKKPIVRWACAMPVGHAIKYPHARYSYRGSGLARASYTGIHPPPTQTRSGCSCWSGCRCGRLHLAVASRGAQGVQRGSAQARFH